MQWLPCSVPPRPVAIRETEHSNRCLSPPHRYVQVIITAERAILPQSALGRPEHAEFVDKLMATIKEAYVARCRLDEEGQDASLDSGKVSAIPKWL